MSFDFSKIAELSTARGKLVELKNSAGRVLWSAAVDYPEGAAVLKVKKITSNTYAGETAYTNEKFILLDIYPKTNGTVTITYGGLTKTITDTSGAAEPNAQKVYFGTFHGISDGVTIVSGTMIIEGDYRGFGISTYTKSNKDLTYSYCSCITDVIDFGASDHIPDYAFYGCSSLKSVVVPSGIAAIGMYAFNGCTELTSLQLSEGVTTLGQSAFDNCTNLSNITIPASTTAINTSYGIFKRCHNLANIVVNSNNPNYYSEGAVLYSKDKTILYAYPSACGDYTVPSHITTFADYAFYECTKLTSVTIPAGIVPTGSYLFEGCTGITSITIPASLCTAPSYYAGWGMFRGCTGLTNVTIPSGAIVVLNLMFSGCTNLENISIPDSVSKIYKSGFEGCTKLTSITVPASVDYIEASAFKLASGNSRTVIMLPTTPPKLSSNDVFDDAGTNNIVVPAGCGETYKAAEHWSEYADYITEAN